MARAFPLQLVLDLTERRAEVKSRAVKIAHATWLRARAGQVRIEQQRARFNAELSHSMRQGCAASVAGQANRILREYQLRLHLAARTVETTHADWQRALAIWQEEKKKLEALQLLARRHALDEMRRENRQERKLHDELAARPAGLGLSTPQRDPGFLPGESSA